MKANTLDRLGVKVGYQAELDLGYLPGVKVMERYRELVKELAGGLGGAEKLVIGVEGSGGQLSRKELEILPQGSGWDEETFFIVERTVKFLLWAWGGHRLYLGGARWIGEKLAAAYSRTGTRKFDVDLMERVYGCDFEVKLMEAEEVPAAVEEVSSVGGHLDGCRIGFDLGASDYKLAAVKDGEAVFSTEIPWDPKNQADSGYHYEKISEGFKLAASHLPRVDAIGGSSAGVYVNNRPMVASLFRSVPAEEFETKVKPMYEKLGKEWGVPLVVINDGDVTALAGAMSLQKPGMLGIAMGSSEAVGFISRKGGIMGWLNELAFAPVDFNEGTARDEWSGDFGVGALYFSQQAVNKLAPAAGLSFPDEMDLPERLKEVQKLAAAGDDAALAIFRTIGVYLGYTLPYYAEFYDFEDLLILGRVTSGRGGEEILRIAREILDQEFPELAKKVSLHVPDEKSRRVGQAVAAASLPRLK